MNNAGCSLFEMLMLFFVLTKRWMPKILCNFDCLWPILNLNFHFPNFRLIYSDRIFFEKLCAILIRIWMLKYLTRLWYAWNCGQKKHIVRNLSAWRKMSRISIVEMKRKVCSLFCSERNESMFRPVPENVTKTKWWYWEKTYTLYSLPIRDDAQHFILQHSNAQHIKCCHCY